MKQFLCLIITVGAGDMAKQLLHLVIQTQIFVLVHDIILRFLLILEESAYYAVLKQHTPSKMQKQ